MRRIIIIALCVLLLTTAVSAAGSVTGMQSAAVLASDGTCQISLVMQLTVDSGDDGLRFPLPGNAKDITLNGSAAKTSRAEGLRWVDLSPAVYGPGVYSLTLHYSLPDLVSQEEKEGLLLQLPLLSGFSYPIERMEFSVTLPGEPEKMPQFTSTYHPESMESYMAYSVDGPVISGYFLQGLKDHETLRMTLPVTGKLFPQTMVKQWSLSYDDVIQYGLLILALLYWLIFLRCRPGKRERRVQPPDGITAGELGCCLCGLGADLPAMVLSWAQMGYLTVQLDRNRRVRLHKTMDMGNERSEFEVRCFKVLFGKRQTVDGSSEHFARLGRKIARTVPNAWHYFRKSSGNPMIFRCIAGCIGGVGGFSLAVAFASDTVWQVLLAILLVPLGAVLSWLIQTGCRGIHLRHRLDLLLAGAASLVWLVLGNWSGEVAVAVFVIASQFLAGFAAIHGGRRTESGLQARNEIFGLRKYLKSVRPEELRRILESNPDYYFTVAPHALALGVDRAFARQFGEMPMPACPYLETSGRETMTAEQWNALLRQVLRSLDERQRRLIWEKLFGRK